jgi:hypothetical protein
MEGRTDSQNKELRHPDDEAWLPFQSVTRSDGVCHYALCRIILLLILFLVDGFQTSLHSIN